MQIINEFTSLFRYHKNNVTKYANHDYFNVFKKNIKRLEDFYGESIKDKKILELGCGQRYSFSLLCAWYGLNVTALDLNYVGGGLLKNFLMTLRNNGLKRAIKSFIRSIFFDSKYYQCLSKNLGEDILRYKDKISFVISEPHSAEYKLDDESFDIIVSNAVLEHVSNVEKFAAEVYRLLKPGGLFLGHIHNYYSLSGGHRMEWAYPDENPSIKVPPWDHLRANIFPTHVYLNKLKPNDFLQIFSKNLKIVSFEPRDINHDLPKNLEGEKFLTEEVYKELEMYPRELLLTRTYELIAKK